MNRNRGGGPTGTILGPCVQRGHDLADRLLPDCGQAENARAQRVKEPEQYLIDEKFVAKLRRLVPARVA